MIKKRVDPFEAKLRAARNYKNLSAQDACWLSVVKRIWLKSAVGLSDEELKRITKLATLGGWTEDPADSEFFYVEDDIVCKA